MHSHGNETDAITGPGYTIVQADERKQIAPQSPLPALASISRDIMANAHRVPDTELTRIAGCLRSLADEVMAVVNRRSGVRPAPRLVVDNTRR